MDNFDLKKYLSEGRLYENSIINLLKNNQKEVAEKTNNDEHFPFDEIDIDDLGDASITLKDEIGGLSFRSPEDVDDEFEGEEGDEPRPITIGGVDLMYIEYDI